MEGDGAGTGLWREVLIQKYIHPLSVLDWIRAPNKSVISASIVWKALVQAFPLVGKWLACRSVRLGVNLWIAKGEMILGCHWIFSCL
jgi:hypothetical protein